MKRRAFLTGLVVFGASMASGTATFAKNSLRGRTRMSGIMDEINFYPHLPDFMEYHNGLIGLTKAKILGNPDIEAFFDANIDKFYESSETFLFNFVAYFETPPSDPEYTKVKWVKLKLQQSDYMDFPSGSGPYRTRIHRYRILENNTGIDISIDNGKTWRPLL